MRHACKNRLLYTEKFARLLKNEVFALRIFQVLKQVACKSADGESCSCFLS